MLFEIGLPRKFAKLSKVLWKFGSFGKEFRWTKFNAVEGVTSARGVRNIKIERHPETGLYSKKIIVPKHCRVPRGGRVIKKEIKLKYV